MKKSILTFIAMAVGSLTAMAQQDKIIVKDFDLPPGATKSISVELGNEKSYTAFQMDVALPRGITLAADNADTLSTERADASHVVDYNEVEDGTIRIIAYSTEKATFRGNGGELLSLRLKADEGMEMGMYALTIKNIRFTETNTVDNVLEDATAQIKVIAAYSITAQSADEAMGSVTLEGGGAMVEHGTTVMATATAAVGHEFLGWTVDGESVSTDNPYIFQAEKDVALVADFAVKTYKVFYIIEYKVVDVPYGGEIPVEAEPVVDGHIFSGWSEIPDSMPANDVVIRGSFAAADAITDVADASADKIVGIYTLDGKKGAKPAPGNVYFIRYASGKVVKRMIK